MEQSPS